MIIISQYLSCGVWHVFVSEDEKVNEREISEAFIARFMGWDDLESK